MCLLRITLQMVDNFDFDETINVEELFRLFVFFFWSLKHRAFFSLYVVFVIQIIWEYLFQKLLSYAAHDMLEL